MKIGFYAEAGIQEIALTPESAAERHMLEVMLLSGSKQLSVKSGAFVHTHGGYIRRDNDPTSVLLVITDAPPPPPEDQL